MLRASGPGDIEPAFVTLVAERAAGLVVSGENLFRTQRDQLVALAARYAVPTLSQFLEFARRGGLMSYGISAPELLRSVGVYAGRILKGEKPADLPVQQATTIKLIINLKTAKALGLNVPPAVLVRADEVIE
jgi:putative tryptophan/tyrosine transport system substrate-binding protein